MREIKIYVYPFPRPDGNSTDLIIDGIRIDNPDNRLHQFVVKKPESKWLCPYTRKLFVWRGFFYELAIELNASGYRVTYYGSKAGYERFSEEAARQSQVLRADGRGVDFELAFEEHFDLSRTAGVVTDALDSIIYKAYSDKLFELGEKASRVKDRFLTIPCRLDYIDCEPTEVSQIAKDFTLKTDAKMPRVYIAVVGSGVTADRLRQVICESENYEFSAVMAPEADRDQAGQALKGRVSLFTYRDDPKKSIEEFIINNYVPSAASKALSGYQEIAGSFDDRDSDFHLIEADEQIDSLYK